ncbi:uncharacterized protein LOC119279343 [Triticum dicoccoides]|uniref:uncharacterized protein LOC119279343 n=1 Tax=Triticum dicoccoides TaxID=85692 RepID=UPI00188E844F|nr:uncharacterized protein LOC119279343 [Triticum dicoccoides]
MRSTQSVPRALVSSPSRPRTPRRRRHLCRPLPATSDAAQHAPELLTVRASLPSDQILRSRPLPPACNPTPVARVPGKASPARLQRPQLFGSSSCRKFLTSLYTVDFARNPSARTPPSAGTSSDLRVERRTSNGQHLILLAELLFLVYNP